MRAGDLVVIPYPGVREALRCPPEAGLLLEDRQSAVKVWFPGADRTFWLDRDKVEAIPAGRLPVHPVLALLHEAARLLSAEQVEPHEVRGEVGVFHLYGRGADLERLLALRALVGEDLRRLRVDAASARRLRVTLALRLPAPLGAAEA